MVLRVWRVILLQSMNKLDNSIESFTTTIHTPSLSLGCISRIVREMSPEYDKNRQNGGLARRNFPLQTAPKMQKSDRYEH